MYLGDGVHAATDGWHITLTVDGEHRIYLDPGVYAALVEYAGTVWPT
jgi:hypothetical protein